MEAWRDVVGYEDIYEVSDNGNIRTKADKITHTDRRGVRHWKQRVLYQKITSCGAHRVDLWKDGSHKTLQVHRIVALAFLEKPYGKDFINHIDGNRHNNNLINLEWCTSTENNNHAFDNGLMTSARKVILTNIISRESLEFRSMSKASLYLNKYHYFICELSKRGISEYNGYKITIFENPSRKGVS
jgi:hypothetical protein